MHDLLDNLTPAQQQAVLHVDGPLLVLAGPGSGKTTVVTRRVAHLLDQGIPPWQILALTFTNKAAGEMRERIERLLPGGLERGLTTATFHSFCARLLRRYAEAAGINERFTVYDASDQRDAITRALNRAQLNSKNWSPAAVGSAISNAKNHLLSAAAFTAESTDFYGRSIARAYTEYERILRENDALDFDDLLLKTAKLLQSGNEVCQQLQQRYRYVMIDEYQDTNHAQFVIADGLASGHKNMCVVGDPDQAIYGWRGADIRNIMEFETHYPGAKIVVLDVNFRSTGHIVDAAGGLIANNSKRREKEVVTNQDAGRKVQVTTAQTEQHEAQVIVDEMRRLNDGDGVPWKEMAVLVRMNALTRVLEDAFRNAQVPYVIARGTAFYGRKEVKDALSYLRLILNGNDEIGLRRIINEPPRGIGKTTLEKVCHFAEQMHIRLSDALARAHQVPGLTKRAVDACRKFSAMLEGWQTMAVEDTGASLRDLVERVVQESGLEKHYKQRRSEEDEERLANLDELISAAAQFETHHLEDRASFFEREERRATEPVPAPAAPAPAAPAPAAPEPVAPDPMMLIDLDAPLEPEEPVADERVDPVGDDGVPVDLSLLDRIGAYLESVALVSDADTVDPERGSVTLMTLHAAKGLEFDVVAVAGLENGVLPHERAATSEDQMEEERRLCFVGVTRARKHLLMTRAAVRTMRGMRLRTIPSPFLDELPSSHVVRTDLAGDGFDDSRRGNFDDVFDAAPNSHAAGIRSSGGGSGYVVGSTVRHPTFGLGKIEALTPRPKGSAARVVFKNAGTRTLILEYAKLQLVD